MNIKFLKFFFDEKDVFMLVFAIVVIFFNLLKIDPGPFDNRSLIVVVLFGLFTRSLVSAIRYDKYFYIMLIGLFLSLFFSPYTVGLYLTVALIWYSKTV
ncbi:MAG: hypothetical protein KatS3mg091_227 [Patescibacteria group bacterium]|nr:MAG: hypothetical protein KatS3mg091_227 [Patescibacteria group bacterium]